MELKKSIVYFYTIQKQLQIPIYRYLYNFCSNVIDFFETKKQYKKKYKYANDLNHTLFTSSLKRILKLHFLLEDFDSYRFVFIDGIYYYNSRISIKSFYKEVAYIFIPNGFFVEKPIEILYIFTGTCPKKILFNTKNLIILGKGSCVKIIERHKNLSLKKENFSYITKVYMNAYSYLDFCKLNNSNSTIYLLDQTCILLEDRSDCNINTFSFCGESIINFLFLYLLGKEVHSNINGLNILQGYINNNTLIEHIYPNSKSSDVYRGIFDKISNTTFNNKIIILKSGKKTNSLQKSTNILLNNKGKVNANPQLEIFADDVKCSHGCIVGQLDYQEIFYLQSRGIPKSDAITKLLFAFSKEILNCLSFQEIRNLINKNINKNVIHSRN